MADKLADKAIQEQIQTLEGWKRKGGQIHKTYQLKSFKDAIIFVNRVASLADEADHHPDIDVRYNKVHLTLTTHSAGGLTEKDFELARRIDHATSAR